MREVGTEAASILLEWMDSVFIENIYLRLLVF